MVAEGLWPAVSKDGTDCINACFIRVGARFNNPLFSLTIALNRLIIKVLGVSVPSIELDLFYTI